MTECVAADASTRSPHERSDMRGGGAARHEPGLRGYAACSRHFLFTMSNSAVFFAPRRVPAPGFLLPLRFASTTPNEGAGGAGRRYPHSARSRKGAHHVCETRPSGANRNGPLGAPPWRFWARSAHSVSGVAPGSVTRTTFAAGCRARSAEGPEPPGCGYEPQAGTPVPAPPSGSSPDDAPHERGYALRIIDAM
jgi:hypothetical protein